MHRLLPITINEFEDESRELVAPSGGKINCLSSSLATAFFAFPQNNYVKLYDRRTSFLDERKIRDVSVIGVSKDHAYFVVQQNESNVNVFETSKYSGSTLSLPHIAPGVRPFKQMTHSKPVMDIVFGDLYPATFYTLSEDGTAVWWDISKYGDKLGFPRRYELKPRALFAFVDKNGKLQHSQCFGVSSGDGYAVLASSVYLVILRRPPLHAVPACHTMTDKEAVKMRFAATKLSFLQNAIICRGRGGIEMRSLRGALLNTWSHEDADDFNPTQCETIYGDKLIATTTSGGIAVLNTNLKPLMVINCSPVIIRSSLGSLLVVLETNAVRIVGPSGLENLNALSNNKR